MHITLEITIAQDYFNEQDKKIDYEETGNNSMISTKQAEDLQNILSSEIAVYTLRRSTGACGSVTDSMISIRRDFINYYEKTYKEKYIEHQDFY